MTSIATKTTALQFNECINHQDIDGLEQLMTNDHTFIDTAENESQGKLKCLQDWEGFFNMFPDYKNIFKTVIAKDDLIILEGYSTCSDKRLEGPAIWTAKIQGGKVAEWRVYDDTSSNRKKLGVE